MMKIATIAAGSIVWIEGVSHVLSTATHILAESDRLRPQPVEPAPKT